ncbi:MAG: tetratricopeptide repeat protein [Minisyncoccia bacterium]
MQKEMLKKYLTPVVIGIVLVGGIVFYFSTRNTTEIVETSQNTETIVDTESENTTVSSTQNTNQNPSGVVANNVDITTTQPQVNKLFTQAVAQEAKGDYVGAKASLDAALKLQPNDPYVTSYYASLYFHMKDYASALVWIDKALALSKYTNPAFWYIKFDIVKAQSNNDPKIVEPVYRDAIVKTKGDINMVTAYASWLGSIGEKSKAIAQWEKAIEIYPKNKAVFEAEIALLKK